MPQSGNNVKGYETSDAVVLTFGSVGEGQTIKRVGTTLVGITPIESSGVAKISVSSSAPSNPTVGDLWIDTSS